MPQIGVSLVEVYPFRFHGDRIQYLLLKRAGGSSLYPGIWQIVTGTIERGETAAQTALREVGEETALSPLKFWVLPETSSFYDHRNDLVQICALFACQLPDGRDPRISHEHVAWQWCSAREAKPLLAWPSQRLHVDLVEQTIVRGDQSAGLLDISTEVL